MRVAHSIFCLPCMQTIPTACKKAVPPDRREGNTTPNALLATARCEVRASKSVERSASKPILACIWGEVAKSADTRNPNTFTC